MAFTPRYDGICHFCGYLTDDDHREGSSLKNKTKQTNAELFRFSSLTYDPLMTQGIR